MSSVCCARASRSTPTLESTRWMQDWEPLTSLRRRCVLRMASVLPLATPSIISLRATSSASIKGRTSADALDIFSRAAKAPWVSPPAVPAPTVVPASASGEMALMTIRTTSP